VHTSVFNWHKGFLSIINQYMDQGPLIPRISTPKCIMSHFTSALLSLGLKAVRLQTHQAEVSRRSILQSPVHPNTSLWRWWGRLRRRSTWTQRAALAHTCCNLWQKDHMAMNTAHSSRQLHYIRTSPHWPDKRKHDVLSRNQAAIMVRHFKLQHRPSVMTY
jgi:hypothetical protein